MSRKFKCYILAEDLKSQRLLRDYARNIVDSRAIQTCAVPSGKQAGEQFVRKKYPERVAEHRRRNKGICACILMVHTDADTQTVENRIRQLDATLSEPRQRDETISLVVPKRHTETWLYWHDGEKTDEDYDFKRDPENKYSRSRKKQIEDLFSSFSEFLYAQTRRNASRRKDTPDSLSRAIAELRRLD